MCGFFKFLFFEVTITCVQNITIPDIFNGEWVIVKWLGSLNGFIEVMSTCGQSIKYQTRHITISDIYIFNGKWVTSGWFGTVWVVFFAHKIQKSIERKTIVIQPAQCKQIWIG